MLNEDGGLSAVWWIRIRLSARGSMVLCVGRNPSFLVTVHCLLLFITFFIACNFHKLLFIVEKGQGNCFIIFIHCSGGRGVP